MSQMTHLLKSLLTRQIWRMPTVFRLAEVLDAHGITQTELARRTGLGLRTVTRLCHNETGQVSLATLDAIAEALTIHPGDLLERNGKRRKGVA
jgi:DNA-binding Xre family transcriptional regulator